MEPGAPGTLPLELSPSNEMFSETCEKGRSYLQTSRIVIAVRSLVPSYTYPFAVLHDYRLSGTRDLVRLIFRTYISYDQTISIGERHFQRAVRLSMDGFHSRT